VPCSIPTHKGANKSRQNLHQSSKSPRKATTDLVVVVAIQRDSVEVTVMVEVDSSYTVMAAAVDLLLSSADACFETDSFFSSLV
jgi:hypothetical protein